MGAYLRKPITDKTSECGEYTVGERKFLYAATAMQGWRVAMEDAYAIVPDFDKGTSLFAVYDGHGGKEVAIYCAAKLGDVIKSTESYHKGDISQALKDAFMKCDEMIMEPETVQEMKRMVNAEVMAESSPTELEEEKDATQEELSALLEEAHMPLHSLLAKYGATNPAKDAETEGNVEAQDVKSVLQMMADQAGIEIEFEDCDSDSESDETENENDDDDETEGVNDITSSGETDFETEICEQKTMIGEEKASLQCDGQTHSTEAMKFSLTSLLTSTGCGTSRAILPLSSSSETTTSSVTDANQSLHQNSQDFRLSLTTNTLLTHRKALGSNINGHHVEKSLRLKENSHEVTKSSTDTDHSTDMMSKSRTSSSCTSDANSSDDSATALNSSAIKPVSKSEPTSKDDGAHAPDSNDFSAATSRTRMIGLKDLLTTAVEDKNSSLVLDTHMDKWMVPHAVKEVPLTRRTRRRPHPGDDVDDLALTEYSAKRHEVMDEEGYHSGTTAVVCILKGDELTVANAGDSRCVVSSKGKALEMSFDHKPTDPPELERIAKAGGQVGIDGRVNGGLNLTRAIGDHFYKGNTSLPLAEQMITAMPDIETLRITEDEEFIFLACDGIWNSKSSQDVVDFINCRISEKSVHGTPTAEDLVAICKSLCDACLAPDTDNDGTGCDNMTCLLVFLQPS